MSKLQLDHIVELKTCWTILQKIAIFRQKEMQQEQMIAQDFQDKFNSAVSDVARNNSYTLILSSQAVAYAAPIVRDDITEQVILKMKSS